MPSINIFFIAFLAIFFCCPLFDSTEGILGGKSVSKSNCVARISIGNRGNSFGSTGAYIEAIKNGRIQGLIISVCRKLANVPRKELYAVAGVTNRLCKPQGNICKVSKVIRHPGWKENNPEKNNICVFVLEKRLKAKKCIVDTVNRQPNQVVKIYGWSANNKRNTGTQLRKLHMAKTSLAHSNECRAVYDYQRLKVPVPWNKRDYYCTRTEQQGQCWNDWGAPLIIKSNTLAGLTTFGGYCGSVRNLMGIAVRGYDIFMFLNKHGYYGCNRQGLREAPQRRLIG